MLVLTRKHGERILIGEDIEVVVLEIHGRRVKLGIRGPSEVPIHRQELSARIARDGPTRRPSAGCRPAPAVAEECEPETLYASASTRPPTAVGR